MKYTRWNTYLLLVQKSKQHVRHYYYYHHNLRLKNHQLLNVNNDQQLSLKIIITNIASDNRLRATLYNETVFHFEMMDHLIYTHYCFILLLTVVFAHRAFLSAALSQPVRVCWLRAPFSGNFKINSYTIGKLSLCQTFWKLNTLSPKRG